MSYDAKSQSVNDLKGEEFYVYLSNINSKNDVRTVNGSVTRKPGVTLFMAHDFPVEYFLLKTTQPVSKALLQQWIGPAFPIEFFGKADDPAREQYLLRKQKAKHS